MRSALLVLTLLAALPWAAAHADVRRCVLPDGTTVFTDQRCDAIGAQPGIPSAPSTPQLRSYRPACPRTLRDLAFEVSASVESHDVNRLAGVYLWSGYGTREGYALMDRLQAIVDRPLVDLQPVYPDGATYAAIDRPRPPVALRLQQTSAHGSTPMHAVFGVRRYLDCWWIVEGGGRRATPAAAPDAAAPPADPRPSDSPPAPDVDTPVD